jgi:L-rhamnose mutarotase/phospholipid N-methyltransferase
MIQQMITHTKATEMAAIYQNNKTRILEMLLEINQLTAQMRSVFFGTLGSTLFNFPGAEYSEPKIEELARQLKRDAWGAMIRKLEIHKYMSSSKQEELARMLSGSYHGNDPLDEMPDITEENIFSVMQGYMQCVPDFMDEAIREEWDFWLPRRDQYRTNAERWKVSKKIVMAYVMQRWDQFSSCHRISYRASKHVNNLDSIFHLLDGKGFPKQYNGPLHNALDGNQTGHGETEYFRFRCWKNGNLHLTIKRLDLLQKFNEIGCGEGAALPNPTDKGYQEPSNVLDDEPPPVESFASLDFFPTPDSVGNVMVSRVCEHFGKTDCRGLTIMEPSAGEGAIVRLVQQMDPSRLYAFEYEYQRYRELERVSDSSTMLERGDFLQVEPFPAMDAIVMNPPFSHGRYMWHIHHAAKFLRKGGILVSVVPASLTGISKKLTHSFWSWLEQQQYRLVPLPVRAFAPSGTGVRTQLLVISRAVSTVRSVAGNRESECVAIL